MYTLTPPNSPKHKPIIQGKKPQNPSVTRNGASQPSPDTRPDTKNAPLFGQYKPPRYTADEYKSLGLEKLSIARDIKDEIEDDLSDAEFFTNKAKKELEIAKKKERDSKRLEHKARTSVFNKRAYRKEALRTKESMFFHEDNANTAAVQSKLANQDAQEKTKERKTLLEDGNFLLDRAEQLKRPLYPAPKYVYPPRGNTYAGHSSSSPHHTSVRVTSSTTYQRGKFHMPDSIFPETIFEEEEPGFMPPPPPRKHSFSSKQTFTAPQPDIPFESYYSYMEPETFEEEPSASRSKSHSYPKKHHTTEPQPDYYYYARPKDSTSEQEEFDEHPFKPFPKPFEQHKSHTFPRPGQPPLRTHKRPQPKPFSTDKPRAATWNGTPKAPPSDFDVNQQEPPFIDPDFSWDDIFSRKSAKQGEPSKHYFEEPESYDQEKFSKQSYEERTPYRQTKSSKPYFEDPASYGQKGSPYTKPKGKYVPPVKPPVFVEPNEKNFKYENWMPEKWQTFTKAPVAIKDVYETKELAQLFSIAVKGIVSPTETKQVQVEENGEKKNRIKVKTSKEMFRDWKVKTHSDKASKEDARIYTALGVLFDETDKQVYEFNKEGQAIRVRRSRGKQPR